ncbi:Hypothetical predicted protein [Mytilus galloprovincialis]|uniref:Uncharacterized protein n=1 Tax=Mytilus galloprovincialis TaxID=29158 RepID=A0A8B6G812_MYTGA|nr:Hypothetical predicted protein [Mytilus galloprovincialis]
MSSSKLLVAVIDIGTTYSGYAFSSTGQKEKVYTYNWNTASFKNSTSILFSPGRAFHSFGYKAEQHFAMLSHTGENRDWYFFKMFKFLLNKYEDLNEKTIIQDFTGKQMLAIKVFSGGIKFMKEHLFTHFKERISRLIDTDIRWVMTVPAVWHSTGQQFVRKSAEKAGIPTDQFTIALEPESAALYCLLELQRSELSPVQPGQKFLLVDCGYRTVEFTIMEARNDNTVMKIQATSGGPWGGIHVDDAFQEYLLEIFSYKLLASLSRNDISDLEINFNILKKTVDTIDKIYKMCLPFSLRHAVKPEMLSSGRLKIDSKVLTAFFDKPIKRICNHIQDTLFSVRLHDTSMLMLVGEFAESKILYDKIQINFPNIQVLKPKYPADAVALGAVEIGHCI